MPDEGREGFGEAAVCEGAAFQPEVGKQTEAIGKKSGQSRKELFCSAFKYAPSCT